jgi:acetyl coenzyme A synthetase (ADP forming)-like protein
MMTIPAGEFVLLRDGGQALIRPCAPEADRGAVLGLLGRLSAESRALRFHSGGIRLDEALAGSVMAGHALVAEREGQLVAVASYSRLVDPTAAEMALAVDDTQRGNGIGTQLFERLSADARREGLLRLRAEVQVQNAGMLALLGDLGFQEKRTAAGGLVQVEVDLRADQAYLARADERQHVAAVASLDPLFRPRAIAVVGASRRPGSIGQAVFTNLLAGAFSGAVYPVNPQASSVCSVRAYPDVASIPDTIDLAVLTVPARRVVEAARDCLAAGVRALVVITAGFAEIGEEGRRLQGELLYLCRSHGARMVGPNSLGMLARQAAAAGGGAINATFAPSLPPAGVVAMSSQSGALGIAILEHARSLGLGIASFVSIGNKADLSSNDLIEYWEEDPAVKVILLYLESFGNPRRFARIARRVGARKPILAVKGGRSTAGRRAAASHTAALAGSDVAVDALFRQAGVIRAETLEELFEVATFFAHQPLPVGNRVAVMTNAGGLGILCADACEANGLELPLLAEGTRATLRGLLPQEASVNNPVDMIASIDAPTYGAVLGLLLADPGIDAVIVLFIPPLVTNATDVADELMAVCTPQPAKPVISCFVGCPVPPALHTAAVVLPAYTFPESAARALGQAAARAKWLARPAGAIPAFADIDRGVARGLVAAALAREERPWLSAAEIATLLTTYGIAQPSGRVVHSAAEAAAACQDLGAPVVVKLVSSTILHKSDVGGVRLNIESPEAAAAAYEAIAAALAARGLAGGMEGALVQPMLTGGVECLVGVVRDPIFGPLIAFGSGGVTAEVLKDVAFRIHPLTDVDAAELIASVKVAALLRGYRGAPAGDIPALQQLLLRISRLIEDVPELAELDLNPVVVRPAGSGVVAIDARIRLAREA